MVIPIIINVAKKVGQGVFKVGKKKIQENTVTQVTFGSNNPGFEVGSKTSNALIVLPDMFGVTDAYKDLANLVGHKKAGFRVLIPDIYRGRVPTSRQEAQQMSESINWSMVLAEVQEAIRYLKSTGSQQVGIVGFGIGGAIALAAALSCPLSCAVIFYGTPRPESFDVGNIKIPTQVHFGQLDDIAGFSDVEVAKAVDAKFKASGVPGEVIIHPECGHSFMYSLSDKGKQLNANMGFTDTPGTVKEAKQALASATTFLKQHLK